MTRAKVLRSTSRSATLSVTAVAAVLALSACGGDDDDTASTTVPPSSSTATAIASSTTTTVVATITTTPPSAPPTTPTLVVEGATVIVANASSVNGAAGRMTDELQAAGFTTGEATNSTETLGTTKVYFNASVPEAEAVANSVVAAFGGGDIVAEPLPTPAPLEDPESIGDAAVLVALGEDAADQTLAQLQGGGSSENTGTSTPGTEAAGTSAPPTSGA